MTERRLHLNLHLVSVWLRCQSYSSNVKRSAYICLLVACTTIISTAHSTWLQMERQLVKKIRSKAYLTVNTTPLAFHWRDWKTKYLNQDSSYPAHIWIQDLPNTKQDCSISLMLSYVRFLCGHDDKTPTSYVFVTTEQTPWGSASQQDVRKSCQRVPWHEET